MDFRMEEKEKKLYSFVSNEDLRSKHVCKEICGSEKSLSSGTSSSNSSCKDDACANSINSNETAISIHSSKDARKKRPHNKFLGVRQRPSGRWVAEIKDASQKLRLWLGTFDKAEDAARAYDDAARFLRGENTRTNFAGSKNCKNVNMQGRSSSSSKIARFLLLRHALANKTTQKNNSTEGRIHYVGTQVTDYCENINSNKNTAMTIFDNGVPSVGSNVCCDHFITNSKTNADMQLNQSLLFNTVCDPKAVISTNLTQNAVFNNDPCNTFDRFCSSGWTLQLQEQNHEQKSSFSHYSHLKRGSKVHVAPSFNASMYSEAEKWYQNLAAPLSFGHSNASLL